MNNPTICVNCNQQISPPNAAYCQHCGAPQPPRQSSSPPVTATQPLPPPSQPPQNQRVSPGIPKTEIEVGSVIGDTFNLYVGHLFQFLIPFLILGAIGIGLSYFADVLVWNFFSAPEDIFIVTGLSVAASIFALLLEGIAAAMIIKMAYDLYQGQNADISDSINLAKSKLGTIIVAAIFYAIPVAIGLFLFIIPGVYRTTILAVYVQCILFENKDAGASLSQSSQYTRNNRMEIFLIFLILTFLTTLISWGLNLFVPSLGLYVNYLVAVVIDSLLAPLGAIAGTIIYIKLKQIQPADVYQA